MFTLTAAVADESVMAETLNCKENVLREIDRVDDL